MNSEHIEPGLDNVFLLAVIASVVLHFAALYSRIDWSTTTTHLVPEEGEPAQIEIPIEFMPIRAQATTKAMVPSETVRSIVEEAEQDHGDIESTHQPQGHYSFIRRQVLLKRYLSEVREEIEAHKYATVTRHRSLVGNTTVCFDILADGSFHRIEILHSSGNPALDRAAVTAVEMSSNKVKRPNTTGSRKITTSAVIKYQFGL